MTLQQLSREDVRRRLVAERLCLRTGPFVVSIRTPIAQLHAALETLYGDFPVVDDPPFADFHVDIEHGRGWHRWIQPRASFAAGGQVLLAPFRLELATAFFEWGLNGCIAQGTHHYLLLHGAVVERNGRALTLLGRSGSGKSTLCAALTIAGWRLLSDEFTLIVPGSTEVMSLARPISLKNESIDLVSALAPDASFGPRAVTMRKGLITHLRPPGESVARMDEPAHLSRVVFVQYDATAGVALRPMSPPEAMSQIARQAFNYGIRGRQGFDHLTWLVDQCACGTLTYGNVHDAVSLLERDDISDAA